MTSSELIELNHLFELHKNSDRALAMSAYMKGHFPFYGIPSPLRRTIQRDWHKENVWSEGLKWSIIFELWDQPEREFQYVACDWLSRWKDSELEEQHIDFIEQLISTKSWWDSVDALAPNILNSYFNKFPHMEHPTIFRWLLTDNMWLRRSCLIYQLKRREKTDVKLLEACIEALIADRQFFIQKAIGWSLRQYAKHDPAYVSELINRLPIQGLALREASKYL